MEHSIISPSSYKRWSNCPASPSLSQLAEERPVHIAAKLGTILHDASESVLLERNESSAFLGTVHKVTGDKIIIEQEHIDTIDTYTDFIKTKKKEMKGELYLERKLELGEEIHPSLFGTADAIVVNDKKISVVDLKTGKWKVEPDDPQLKIYALGSLLDKDIQKELDTEISQVETTIVQPKLKQQVSTIEHDLHALVDWGLTELKQAAERCFETDPQPVAGDWCRFCPAKEKICPLYNSGEKNE